jgi:hypothetical protein
MLHPLLAMAGGCSFMFAALVLLHMRTQLMQQRIERLLQRALDKIALED